MPADRLDLAAAGGERRGPPPPAHIDSKSYTAPPRNLYQCPPRTPRMAAPFSESETMRITNSLCSAPLEGVEDLRLQRLGHPEQNFGGAFP